MDNDYADIVQELNASQTRITSFFKDVWNEYNQYRKTVDTLSNKYSSLLSEHSRVCKENHSLKTTNKKLNELIFTFFNFIKDFDYSSNNSKETLISALETIKNKIAIDLRNKQDSPFINQEAATHASKNTQDTQSTSTCLSASHLSSSPEKTQIHHKENDKTKNLGKRVTLVKNKTEDGTEVRDTDHSSVQENKVTENYLPSPSRKPNVIFMNESKSPVLAYLGRKHLHPNKDDKLFEDRATDGEKKIGRHLNREKFLVEPSRALIDSPLKRSSNGYDKPEERSKSCENTPKRCRTTIRRGWKSPSSQSKKPNFGEGSKKMTQTLLNIDLFKIKSPEKGMISKSSPRSCSSKVSMNFEEDDLILESPRIFGPLQGAAVIRKLHNSDSNGTETTEGAIDPDETYVPAEIVQTCQLTDERTWKPENSNKKEMFHIRPKSPEYDSVPYIYKREMDKKVSEKPNITRPTCLDCLKYFNFQEYTNTDNKIMEFCSKHRKGNNRNLNVEDTPPGYWKPYLTNTIMSLSDDEAG